MIALSAPVFADEGNNESGKGCTAITEVGTGAASTLMKEVRSLTGTCHRQANAGTGTTLVQFLSWLLANETRITAEWLRYPLAEGGIGRRRCHGRRRY